MEVEGATDEGAGSLRRADDMDQTQSSGGWQSTQTRGTVLWDHPTITAMDVAVNRTDESANQVFDCINPVPSVDEIQLVPNLVV